MLEKEYEKSDDRARSDSDSLSLFRFEQAELSWHCRKVRCTVDQEWVLAIEKGLPYLDAALREPLHTVTETAQVKPIALASHINSRSLRHLARHSEYLRNVTEGKPRPDKILDVRYEDSLQVYENRFLNTLIHRLYAFIDRRYQALCEHVPQEKDMWMTMEAPLEKGNRHGRFQLRIEMTEQGEIDREKDKHAAWVVRVERLHRMAARYCRSELAQKMGNQRVRTPIMPTNAITKNKNLYQCMRLFSFLESYDRIGYQIETEEHAACPHEENLREWYALAHQQVNAFLRQVDGEDEVLAHSPYEGVVHPKLITRFEQRETAQFDVIDTEYRPVFPLFVEQHSAHALSEDEETIWHAVEAALAAEEILQRCREASAAEAGKGDRAIINLDTLCEVFPDGAEITPEILRQMHLILPHIRYVKILARGQIDKAFRVTAHAFSAEAKRYIEEAGGLATRCEEGPKRK